MGKLVYGMSVSLDGYVNGPDGGFGWTESDEELHRFASARQHGVGTYLMGRRMFEAMRVWDDEAALADLPEYFLDYVPIWRTADKVVYSTTLEQTTLPRTRIERWLDLGAVRALKESSERDLEVAGPTLASELLHAGLVDEITLFVAPVVVGAGTRFLPDQLSLDLTLVEQRRFTPGNVFLRYAVRR